MYIIRTKKKREVQDYCKANCYNVHCFFRQYFGWSYQHSSGLTDVTEFMIGTTIL